MTARRKEGKEEGTLGVGRVVREILKGKGFEQRRARCDCKQTGTLRAEGSWSRVSIWPGKKMQGAGYSEAILSRKGGPVRVGGEQKKTT